ncbi:hypothetical protein Tco_0213641 [Tanacetum coccineum]
MIGVRGTVHRIAGTRFLEGYVACSHWWIQLSKAGVRVSAKIVSSGASGGEWCNRVEVEKGTKGPLNGGFCSFYTSRARNSFAYDPNPNSFNDSPSVFTHPLQLQFETYLCELCGNNAHYGYDCPPQFPLEGQNNTHDLPTEEPEYSLSMGDEHLSTIPETESDEVIKSSVENLVPIPSESEVTSDNESECDVPVNDESSPIFTTFSNPLFDCNDDFTSSDDKSLSNEDVPMENFKIYSNPLFDDEEIISTKIDPHYFNAESNLIESLLNRDTLIDSSPKIDSLLEEFSGELTHIDPIPPGIEKVDFNLEEEIHLVENLLYDNSFPRPLEELNLEIADTILESLSPSPIPVEDSDSHMEEIDLFLTTDDSMPPSIENDDYDSEGDIRFLEELLSIDPLPLPEIESSNLDHFNDPSSPRPPLEPPDVEVFFDFEPDTGVLTSRW